MKKQILKAVTYETLNIDNPLRENTPGYDSKIGDRTIQLSLRVIKLYREIEKENLGRILGK